MIDNMKCCTAVHIGKSNRSCTDRVGKTGNHIGDNQWETEVEEMLIDSKLCCIVGRIGEDKYHHMVSCENI